MHTNHSNDAIVPALLSVFAFILSLAGWWLAWVAGLITMAIWVLAMCCDLPEMIMKSTLVFGIIAFVGELLVALRVFDVSIVCDNCSFLNTTNIMIVSIVATVLWGIVVFLSYRKHW